MKIEKTWVSKDGQREVVLASGAPEETPEIPGMLRGWWVYDDKDIDRVAGLLLDTDSGWMPSELAPFGDDMLLAVRAVQKTEPAAHLADLKEGLSSARKADITHIRTPLKVYGARACEYGSSKYERSNYLRPVKPGATLKENFERYRAYLRAAASHIDTVLDAMELHQSGDPTLTNEAGMRAAAYCEDTDTKPGDKVPASGLPHLCGAVASLNMALTQAVTYGLLPADPGQPWTKGAK